MYSSMEVSSKGPAMLPQQQVLCSLYYLNVYMFIGLSLYCIFLHFSLPTSSTTTAPTAFQPFFLFDHNGVNSNCIPVFNISNLSSSGSSSGSWTRSEACRKYSVVSGGQTKK